MASLLDGVTDKKFKEYYIKYCSFYKYEIEDVANLIRYIETVLSYSNISNSWKISSINLINGEYTAINNTQKMYFWNYRESWRNGKEGALRDFIYNFDISCNPF